MMTSARARTNRAIWRPTEPDLGGAPGDPVDLFAFSPTEVAARILGGELTAGLVEQVEVGAEFLPRARAGLHRCLQCEGPFAGTPSLIGWLQTPAGGKRALFGICQECDRPGIKQLLITRIGGTEITLH